MASSWSGRITCEICGGAVFVAYAGDREQFLTILRQFAKDHTHGDRGDVRINWVEDPAGGNLSV